VYLVARLRNIGAPLSRRVRKGRATPNRDAHCGGVIHISEAEAATTNVATLLAHVFFGRPTIEELRQDLRAVLKKCRPDWDITRPELKAAWERDERDRFYPYGKTYGQVFREQE